MNDELKISLLEAKRELDGAGRYTALYHAWGVIHMAEEIERLETAAKGTAELVNSLRRDLAGEKMIRAVDNNVNLRIVKELEDLQSAAGWLVEQLAEHVHLFLYLCPYCDRDIEKTEHAENCKFAAMLKKYSLPAKETE